MRHLFAAVFICVLTLTIPALILADEQGSPSAAVENSLGMKFVLVPAGDFLMGSDESPNALSKDYPQYERRRVQELGDEAPVHRVRITQPFYLGQFEVTVGQFRKFSNVRWGQVQNQESLFLRTRIPIVVGYN